MGRKEILAGAILILMASLPLVSGLGSLTAGDWEDNRNFWHFEEYLKDTYSTYGDRGLPELELTDRISLSIEDKNGEGLPNPHVIVMDPSGDDPILDTYGCYDGYFRFFPTVDCSGDVHSRYRVIVSPSERFDLRKEIILDLENLGPDRTVTVRFEDYEYQCPDALDIAFVVDTTGSMSDELEYLKNEFGSIVQDVRESFDVSKMRFALVVYRDLGDDFVTRSFPFTDSMEKMQSTLDDQRADGGGDTEEAVELGLREGVNLDWGTGNTARMMIWVADASPHEENYHATFQEVLRARNRGIHVYPLASSGIDDITEFFMRCSSVLSHGRYLFLTDDSGIGNPHAEPHIPAYVVTRLGDLMFRLVESELRGKWIEPEESTVIRRVGIIENGTAVPPTPPDQEGAEPSNSSMDEETYPVDDITEKEIDPSADNSTDNSTDPHGDPPLEGEVDHDDPDPTEEDDDGTGVGSTYEADHSHDSGTEICGAPPSSYDGYPSDPSWSAEDSITDMDGMVDHWEVSYYRDTDGPRAASWDDHEDVMPSHPAPCFASDKDALFPWTLIITLGSIGAVVVISSITGGLIYRRRRGFVIYLEE
ncbi:MAG: vWA domain-containing protein [Thermoplasmatota archaeon]